MRGRKGFSLAEMLISVIIAGLGFMAAAHLFDVFFNLHNERTAVPTSDVNQQVTVLTGAVRNGKVTAINSDGFTIATNYFSGSNESVAVKYDATNKRLLLKGTVLFQNVKSATFTYYDYRRASTTTPANVKAVKISITYAVDAKKNKYDTRNIEVPTKS